MTDEFDDELRHALWARSGDAVGTTSAHEAVVGRAATIRRRRAVTAGSGALLVLALGALALVPRDGDDRIAPADDVTLPSVDTTDVDEDAGAALPTTTVDTDEDSTGTTAAPTSTTVASGSTILGGGAVTTTDAGAAAPTTDAGGTPPPAVAPTVSTTVTTATTQVAPTTTAAPTTVATTSPTTTTASPTGTPPFTKTYPSSGGSITVDWNGASLSLLSVEPAAGYAAEIEDQTSSRIRVRFRGDDDARIEVRVNDGQVEEVIS